MSAFVHLHNHSEYSLGWSYKGYAIGNPFIDNLNSNPSKVIHTGLTYDNLNHYKLKFLISRRVDINDSFKYSINFGKVFNKLST